MKRTRRRPSTVDLVLVAEIVYGCLLPHSLPPLSTSFPVDPGKRPMPIQPEPRDPDPLGALVFVELDDRYRRLYDNLIRVGYS